MLKTTLAIILATTLPTLAFASTHHAHQVAYSIDDSYYGEHYNHNSHRGHNDSYDNCCDQGYNHHRRHH